MINSKKELKFYLKQDKIALHIYRKKPHFYGDEIWKFQIRLRKTEYFFNCKHYLRYYFSKVLLHHLYIKYSLCIPLNVFGPGLSIAHLGNIIVSSESNIGKNCRIHETVTIGATSGHKESATLGDNVFIGSGAKIIGNVKIADNVVIGANCVVVKDILEESTTWGGVPAKKISDHDSKSFLDDRLFK